MPTPVLLKNVFHAKCTDCNGIIVKIKNLGQKRKRTIIVVWRL
jgi:hypothetical protein